MMLQMFLSQPATRSGEPRRPRSGRQHGRCTRTRRVRAAFSPPSSGKCPCSPPRWRPGGWNPCRSGWMPLAGDVSPDFQIRFLLARARAAQNQLRHTVNAELTGPRTQTARPGGARWRPFLVQFHLTQPPADGALTSFVETFPEKHEDRTLSACSSVIEPSVMCL